MVFSLVTSVSLARQLLGGSVSVLHALLSNNNPNFMFSFDFSVYYSGDNRENFPIIAI